MASSNPDNDILARSLVLVSFIVSKKRMLNLTLGAQK